MASLTRTQNDLLVVLRARRDVADATEELANATAIGGLTEKERFERGAVWCRAHRELVAHTVLNGGAFRYAVRCVRPETFHALENAGLVERLGQLVRAKAAQR